MPRLNYHHLYYFYIIAKKGSIANASESLHITPQTLSSQLNTLEERLGFSLFDRKGKRLNLNDNGKLTYSYAEEIFSIGDELVSSLKHRETNTPLHFTIGVADVIAKVFSFNLIRQVFSTENPVKLICEEGSFDRLLSELAINKLDAVLSECPIPTGTAVKAYNHLLGDSGMSFFADKKSSPKLAKNFPRSLDDYPFLMPGERTSQRINLLSWFQQLDISPVVIAEFDDTALMKYFGQSGYGVFCAPTIIEQHIVEQFKVKIIGRTDDIRERFYLISPERKVRHPAVLHLLQTGRELFNQPMR